MPVRSIYIDTLRAIAIVRVYLLHTLWFSWLTLIYPSMSVMFALGGTLIAASVERGGAARTVRSRLQRLLMPLWVLAAVTVPLLLVHGWHPRPWYEPFYWVLPLANPPGNDWGGPFTLALWYVRAYVWFVLLTPLLWMAFKRWPIVTIVTPFVLALVVYVPLVNMPANQITDVIASMATYGTCWVLGFARHTRLLDRLPMWICASLAGVLAVTGFAWGVHKAGFQSPMTNQLADTLYGLAFVLVLMRVRPTLSFVDKRMPRIATVIKAINARAVTIYIWHLPMLFAAASLIALTAIHSQGPGEGWPAIILGTLLTIAMIPAAGWIEDIAARRRPMLNPVAPPLPPPPTHTPAKTLVSAS